LRTRIRIIAMSAMLFMLGSVTVWSSAAGASNNLRSFSPRGHTPGTVTTGADGNLWFIADATTIVQMTPKGRMHPYTLALHDYLAQLTLGPDGNIWFTEGCGGYAGRITPEGDATEFSTGNVNACLGAITTGPDGNLWFGTDNLGKVGRMTPQGQTTFFWALVDYPGQMTSGPDGNLWYVGADKNDIGYIVRMNTQGTVTLKIKGVGYQGFTGIVSGPDGNLWVTRIDDWNDDPAIVKVATDGTLTNYPIASDPRGITVGSDSALWFGTVDDQLGRITTSGDITMHPLSTDVTIGRVTSGPDGNIWFNDTRNHLVWVRRIT
jgi:streptogramin lyase